MACVHRSILSASDFFFRMLPSRRWYDCLPNHEFIFSLFFDWLLNVLPRECFAHIMPFPFHFSCVLFLRSFLCSIYYFYIQCGCLVRKTFHSALRVSVNRIFSVLFFTTYNISFMFHNCIVIVYFLIFFYFEIFFLFCIKLFNMAHGTFIWVFIFLCRSIGGLS